MRSVFLCTAILAALAIAARPAAQTGARVDTAAALRSVVPDLNRRLAQFKQVRMPYDSAALSAKERQLIDQLVIACQRLESMYWRQSDPEGMALFNALAADASPTAQAVRHYIFINGSRFDLVDDNKPFVGTQPMPPGHALYPAGMTRRDIDAYVAAHPDKKAMIYDPYTMVHRQGAELTGRKYHDEFASFVAQAAAALRNAAGLSDDPAFAKFLRLRADALMKDDYYESDVAWLEMKDPKFDIIFAPYETYLDDLLGVKTSYGASILIRNKAESDKLAAYEQWVPDIQDALPLAPEDRPSVRGKATPMEVMDAPYRAGDLRHGYQAVADNLPNDPRIHQEKGTKKIFFKNFMDARGKEVILPLAAKVMDPADAARASAEGYLASTIMHEICHGLGPAFSRQNGRQIDTREAIGSTYSGLEEAKADVVGVHSLKWLIDHGHLAADRLPEYYASYVAGIFRTVRFGTGEAHGRAEMMEFNFLSDRGAIVRTNGLYHVVFDKMPAAIDALAKELLDQEATGDRARAQAWFTKYDKMPPDLTAALASAKDVPIDIDPVFSFPEPVQ